jgi:hypothetical protein
VRWSWALGRVGAPSPCVSAVLGPLMVSRVTSRQATVLMGRSFAIEYFMDWWAGNRGGWGDVWGHGAG